MKNKDFYIRVAEKTGYSVEHINYFSNFMFKNIKQHMILKDYPSIKFGGFINLEVSLQNVNNLIRRFYLPNFRKKRDDERLIERFRHLWQVRQMLIKHNKTFKANRPKRWRKTKTN